MRNTKVLYQKFTWGKCNECLDLIDVTIELNIALANLKSLLSAQQSQTQRYVVTGPSAFDVLMSAQHARSLPNRIEKYKK